MAFNESMESVAICYQLSRLAGHHCEGPSRPEVIDVMEHSQQGRHAESCERESA
jgi:hypothetical protein